MTFLEAQHRLLAELRTKVQNGQLTEREMARLTGVSQPHIHNVLKGVRNLSPEIADRILKTFHLSVLDFSSPNELHDRMSARGQRLLLVEMPVLRSPVGPNQPWRHELSARERITLPIPMQRTRPNLAAVRLEYDPRMGDVLGNRDLAALNIAAGRHCRLTRPVCTWSRQPEAPRSAICAPAQRASMWRQRTCWIRLAIGKWRTAPAVSAPDYCGSAARMTGIWKCISAGGC